MTLKIQVYSDYVCPFCFLGEAPLVKAIEGKDIEVEWMPFELRPYPSEPLDPVNDPSKRRIWESSITPYAQKLGLDMKLPQVSPHPYTHLAFEGYQYAKEHGKGTAYNHRVFTAFFQEEQNIGELEVLSRLSAEVGLDADDFKAALTSSRYKEAHQKALRHAYEEANVHAVPTFVIGHTVLQGIQRQETLEKLIQEEMNNQHVDIPDGLTCE